MCDGASLRKKKSKSYLHIWIDYLSRLRSVWPGDVEAAAHLRK